MTKLNPNECAVYFEDVIQSYDGKLVLNDVDLAVRPSQFVTLVGPSGCGKSTLLKLLSGEERPKSGTVLIAGAVHERPDRNRGIVYQKFPVYPHLTALDNVAIGPIMEKSGIVERWLNWRTNRRKHDAIMDEAREYLHMMDLDAALDKYPHQLSGGMQQRVAIAQALIMHPKVLLMDEPFSALDPWTREELQMYLLELWQKERMTVFFVTHDLEEAIFLGTRIVVLSQRYHTELGDGRGSRVIMDLPITEPYPRRPEFKSSQELGDMLLRIRKIAFDRRASGALVHVDDFALEDDDSFHTTLPGERRNDGKQ